MNNTGGIEYVRFSNDFKNRAGRKAAVFFFAEDLICFFILLPAVLLTLFLMKADTAAFWSTPFLLAGFWLLTLCRLKPNRLWKSILFTLVSAAAMLAVFLITANYAAAAAIFCDMILSYIKTGRNFTQTFEMAISRGGRRKGPVFRKRTSDDRGRKDEVSSPVYFSEKMVLPAGILNFILYLTALGFGFNSLALFCIIDFAVVFALMMIYIQKSGAYCLSLWDKLSKTENTGGRAEKAGGALLAFLTSVGTAVIALILFSYAAISGNFQIDNAFIAHLISAFNAKPLPKRSQDVPPPPVNSDMKDLLGETLKQPQKESPAAGVIRNVLNVVMWCVIVLAAVFLLAAIGSAVIRFYRKLNMNVNEDSRSLLFEKKENEGKIKIDFGPLKNRFGFFSRRGSRSTIRRLFFFHIKKRRGGAVKKSDTPFEIGYQINDGSDMKKAAEVYEKARYSSDVCDESDVKEMRRALKKNRRTDENARSAAGNH